ncbi:MobF family relaxase [Corynebacterium alimapuense]|nr:MobF family relaxase [Corynebacterium alimapuense]
MMSIRAVHAGDGYAYLLNSVASHDDTNQPETRLSDYYNATGTPPGRWFGQGINGLGNTTLTAGGIVEEEQMATLYGEGFHPDAEAMIYAGASLDEIKLGRAYPNYAKDVPVLEAVKREEKSFRTEHDRRPTQAERNLIGLEVARPYFHAAQDTSTSSSREVLAWLNEEKNKVKQAVSSADLTFSPTKSVSILWALGDDETRKTIEKIHQESVQDSLEWIENNLLYTRTGARGERQIKASGMIAATFQHYDTRAGDPDLHTHCLISNKVQADPETSGLSAADSAKWRSVDASVLFKNSARIGQRYQRMMVQRLSQQLGLDFHDRRTPAHKQPVWEIAGIDEHLIETFSHRRADARPVYEKYAAEYATTHGHSPSDRVQYALWQQAILDTRDAKKPAQSLADHRAQWAQLHNGQALSIEDLQGQSYRASFPHREADSYYEAVVTLAEQAVNDTRSRRADFQIRHLDTSLSTRLNQWSFATEADADHARDSALTYAMDHLVVELGGTVNTNLPTALLHEDGRVIDQDAESQILTARATVAEESAVLDALNEPTAWTVSHAQVREAITNNARLRGFELNTGQQLLAQHLTESGMQITAGVGPAGTGKTASMAMVADIWRAHHRDVIALAPSATAAQQLGSDIDTPGMTLASLTYRWRGIVGDHPRSVEHLGCEINPGDMLLLDEAGMATTADLAALTDIATATGAVVRMVGDPHQLDAVETGGLFRTITNREHSVELNHVMRMGADTAQADAGLAIRHGDLTGLDLYHRRGWVHHGTRGDMIAHAASAHLNDEASGLSSILIASSRDDVNTANQIIRDARIHAGLVNANGPHVSLGTGQQASVGDTILTRKNQTINGHRVLNGHRFTISQVRADGGLMVVDQQRQRPQLLPAGYVSEHVQLGYSATVHRAQGVTVDHARAVVGPQTDRRGLYVALTRGKKQNHVYVAEDIQSDLESEDAHWHMSGEHHALDYREILNSIVERDQGQRSATDLDRELLTEQASDQRRGELLATATDMLTTQWRRDVVELDIRRRLDELPVADLEAIDEDQAVERISTAVVTLSRQGVDYREVIDEAMSGLAGSRDVGAVIAARLSQHIPAEKPAVTHLPPRHVSADHELYDWAENTYEELARTTERELRPLEHPLPDKGEVTEQDFSNVDFRGLELRGLKFIDCTFDGAAFDDAEIHRTSFTDCSMRDVSFNRTAWGVGDGPLKLSLLTRCDLSGADATDAQFARSRFTSCSMRDVTLSGALMAGRFERVDFSGADFSDVEIAKNLSVADSTLDNDAHAAFHQAQELTEEGRQQRRREYAAQEDAVVESSTTAPVTHHVGNHTDKGLEL